jgi:DNA polymerase-4
MTLPAPNPPPIYHRKVIHIDMDAFYASVEQRNDPRLRGQPVVVGGDPEQRGVVAAASYEARAFGIRSAMPMKTALRQCPGAIRVPADFATYRRVSSELHEILHEYTDLVEPVALDEAYLDVTYNKLDIPFGQRAARMIKTDIHRRLQLTASAGVGPNKFLAKIASDLEKPNGLVVVKPGAVGDFLRELPVGKISGVGEVTRCRLLEMAVTTVGELAQVPEEELIQRLGKRGARLHRLSMGIDDDPVTPEREPKQLSSETTFTADLYDAEEMRSALKQLAEGLSGRLRRRGLSGRVLTLKVRYPDFETVTRSQTRTFPEDRSATLLRRACELLRRTAAKRRGVRLLGLGVSGFGGGEESRQLDLFE